MWGFRLNSPYVKLVELMDRATMRELPIALLISLAIGLGGLSNAYAIQACWKSTGVVRECPWQGCVAPTRPQQPGSLTQTKAFISPPFRHASAPPGCEDCHQIPGFGWCPGPYPHGGSCDLRSDTTCWVRVDRLNVAQHQCEPRVTAGNCLPSPR